MGQNPPLSANVSITQTLRRPFVSECQKLPNHNPFALTDLSAYAYPLLPEWPNNTPISPNYNYLKISLKKKKKIAFLNVFISAVNICQTPLLPLSDKGCFLEDFCTVKFPSFSIMGPPPITELVQYWHGTSSNQRPVGLQLRQRPICTQRPFPGTSKHWRGG